MKGYIKFKQLIKGTVGINAYNFLVKMHRIMHSIPNIFYVPRYFWRKKKHIKRKSIVVIGDSHVNFFSGNEHIRRRPISRKYGGINISKDSNKMFDAIHIGPAIAYNVGKYGTTVKAREKIDFLCKHFISKEERILFSFGEIDLRFHVFKYTEQLNIDYKIVIDSILKKYMEFLFEYNNDYDVWVWGPIPSQKDEWYSNFSFPCTGTEIQRNMATAYFNEELEKLCQEKGIKFLTIFPDLVTEDYKTREEYISDGCHLSQKAWNIAREEFQIKNFEEL